MEDHAGAGAGTNGTAGAAQAAFDIGGAVKVAQSLMSQSGGLPEWVFWAIGAAAVGGAMGVMFDKDKRRQQAQVYCSTTTSYPAPSRAPVPDRLERLRAIRDLGAERECLLGFYQSGIGPKTGAISIVSRPQVPFLGERLRIPSSLGALFAIVDIKVGNHGQLGNSTAIPAHNFTDSVAREIRLRLDPADIGQDVAIVAENLTEDPQTFVATLVGTPGERCGACGGFGRSSRYDTGSRPAHSAPHMPHMHDFGHV